MYIKKLYCHNLIHEEHGKVMSQSDTALWADVVVGKSFYQQTSLVGERAHSAWGTLFAGTSRMSAVAVCQGRSTDISV